MDKDKVKEKMLLFSEVDAESSTDILKFSLEGGQGAAMGAKEDIEYVHNKYTLAGSVPNEWSVF